LEEIINPATSYKLDSLYEYRNQNDVAHYLQSYPGLNDFLEESYYHVRKYFGATAKLALEVIREPEAQYKQLMVYINTSLPVDEALNRLDRFDNQWFLDHINQIGHLINFNLEIA
jgi:hypothetical protein